jgi:general secretion pathway protein I
MWRQPSERPHPRCARAGGFSLLETLVAVTIFAIAIVAIIETIANNSRTQMWVEDESRAAVLAQNIMEEIEYVAEQRVGTDNGQFEGDDSRFAWMTDTLATENPDLFEVHVLISWKEGEAERDYRLVTYMRQGNSATSTTLQQSSY